MGQEPPNKIIYSMIRVSKYYDKKPVLKDISISYFYGAKIGVLGLNGSGKSTLLRVFAGVDKEFNGQTSISPGLTVGLLDQEPQLDNTKTVRDIVEEGLQETVALVNEFNRINEQFANPMSDDEMNRLIERQGEVQEKIDALEAWDLDSRLEMAMDALRCPPGETPVNVLSGGERRRVALCRLLRETPSLSRVPLLVVSSKAGEMDRILAFEAGADDFLAKPFYPPELAARIRAVLRAFEAGIPSDEPAPVSGKVRVDASRGRAEVDGERIDLTPTEFQILTAMLSRAGKVVRRRELIERLWGPDVPVSDRAIDAHVKSIRRKLGSARNCIETVRAVGYRFSDSG